MNQSFRTYGETKPHKWNRKISGVRRREPYENIMESTEKTFLYS